MSIQNWSKKRWFSAKLRCTL